MNETIRKWWEKLLAVRKKGGPAIVVRSRLHEADLIGHILDPDGAKFKALNLSDHYEPKRGQDMTADDSNWFLPKMPVDLPKDTRPFIWTDAQCFAMNAAQHDGNRHPYTCGKDSRHRPLIATRRGWRCCDCDYLQGRHHGAPETNRVTVADELLELTLSAAENGGQNPPVGDEERLSIGRWEPDPASWPVAGLPRFVAVISVTGGQIRQMIDPEYRKGEDPSGTM